MAERTAQQMEAVYPDVLERDASLRDARECLRYWESREGGLPLRAVSQRREAREMAARWRERVADAEDALYGRGVLGAMLLVAAERRLPARSRHAGQRVVRTGARVAMVVAVVVLAAIIAIVAAAIGLLVAVF